MKIKYLTILIGAFIYAFPAWGKLYQSPQAFLADSLENPIPKIHTITTEQAKDVAKIRQGFYEPQRIRYWQDGKRTVWILQHIGKTHPITAGFVIENNQIITAKVLEFKESRGWEIRLKYFTDQFKENHLTESHLAKKIDNITGATLSVRAMEKMAKTALYINQHTKSQPQ